MSAPEIGKWKVSLGALSIGDIEIGDEHGNIVATVQTMRRRYHNRTDLAWATANAIAAAPEMLEALKAVRAEAKEDSAEMWAKVEDAIAKAEGRAA